MKAQVSRLELVDPAVRADKFYSMWMIQTSQGPLLRAQYGPRPLPGTLSAPHRPSPEEASAVLRSYLRRKRRTGYSPVVQDLELDLDEDLDVLSLDRDTAKAFDAAMRASWCESWADRLRSLPAPGVAPVHGWVVLVPNLMGQVRSQPWGPALESALRGCPRVDGALPTGASVSLALVGDRLASWLRRHYTFEVGTGDFPQLEEVPARITDSRELLELAFGLWTPGADDDVASFSSTVAMARAVLAPAPPFAP